MLIVFAIVSISFSVETKQIGKTEILRWHKGCKAAISLTFDDNLLSQLDFAIPQLEKYGFRGTFYIVAQWLDDQAKWDGNAERWHQAHLKGHEIGCHSYSHKYLTWLDSNQLFEQTRYAKSVIERIIGNGNCQIFRQPWGDSNKKVDSILSTIFPLNAIDIEKINQVCLIGATQAKEILQEFNKTISDSGFAVTIHHGVGKDILRISESDFIEVMEFLKNHNEVWVAPHGSVIKYSIERDSCKLKVDSLVRVSTPISLIPSIYNEPLWLKTMVSKKCEFVQVFSKTGSNLLRPITDTTGTYIVYALSPNDTAKLKEFTPFDEKKLKFRNTMVLSLKDSSSLKNWKKIDGDWSIVDGSLTSGESTSKLIWEKELTDFKVAGKVRSVSNNKTRSSFSIAGFYIRSEECLTGENNGKYYEIDNHSSISDFRPNRILLWDQETSRDASKTPYYWPDQLSGTFECDLSIDKWHNFEICVIGNKLVYKVDGKVTMISEQINRKSGKFGIYSRGTSANFKDITISEL